MTIAKKLQLPTVSTNLTPLITIPNTLCSSKVKFPQPATLQALAGSELGYNQELPVTPVITRYPSSKNGIKHMI